MHIEKHYDATSLMLGFGSLLEELQPNARYLIPDENIPGRFKAVLWGEFQACFPGATPGKGLLEFMAVETSVTTERNGIEDERKFLQPPCVLTQCNASTTFEAVDPARQL